MRGRKPTPTEIKLGRGNPGRRPVNEHEPKHEALDPRCPAELVDPVARAEWDRVARALGSRGHVTTVDRATLILYCVKWAQWIALEREAAALPLTSRTSTGYLVPNALLGMANKAALVWCKAAIELGITPSSRSRVSAVGTPAIEDAFATLQAARPRLVK
jgi:P27 family predicted phage terminase small subunit